MGIYRTWAVSLVAAFGVLRREPAVCCLLALTRKFNIGGPKISWEVPALLLRLFAVGVIANAAAVVRTDSELIAAVRKLNLLPFRQQVVFRFGLADILNWSNRASHFCIRFRDPAGSLPANTRRNTYWRTSKFRVRAIVAHGTNLKF